MSRRKDPTQPMTNMSTAEAEELADAVRAVCNKYAQPEQVLATAYENADGYDEELWSVLCRQVGVAAIAVPEHLGGAGYGTAALGVVAHELGRALAPVPFLSSAVLATGLLADVHDVRSLAAQRLSDLGDGARTAAAILTADGGKWAPATVPFAAHRDGEDWRATGTARHVLGGASADDLVIAATTVDGLALLVVDPADTAITAERPLDGTRPLATVVCMNAPAVRIASAGVEGIVERNVMRALAVLAAEQVGACERLLELSTEYARTRIQFGRPIGAFQAVKHRCADMLVSLEWARSASQAALLALEENTPAADPRWRASMAKAVCSEALREAAHANIQIHGGIGFTWENSANLYVRRARSDEALFGLPGRHWDVLGAHIRAMDGDPDAGGPDDTGGIGAVAATQALRSEIREFLTAAPKPAGLRNYGPTPTSDDVEPGRIWHRYLADHGYACLHWPREYGGADASVAHQAIFAEECATAGVPRQLGITAIDLVGPVLIAYGSDEQKRRHLEPIRRGEHIWTQLFSEPGAGSDLAGIRTKAQRTESGWRVDGQKVWSSAAKSAVFGLLLARTGPDAHRGLSMFIVPMDADGVTVRPLKQIDGESKFNEVFLDSVDLPESSLIGEEGQGWKIAMLTLGRERLTLGSQAVGMFQRHARMTEEARHRGALDETLERALTRLWARMWLLRFTCQRAVADGDTTSAAFSVLKLMTSETDRDLGDLATEVLGTDACVDPGTDELVQQMLVGRAQTILGGTSEIQRNILGERVLKLPKDPR
ncbi:acyl-CoA dehydrogenase [Mycobacterium sp. 050134]|uniref:acyl-CoA dehydrogenase n=1 Tax=Mycobacterium sp. 050134 TaxID=3096111 RepID=UPI002ED83D71